MDHYILTIYREDDTTPWFEVGTHPTHPAPYLHEPGEVDAGEVDFLEGRATIGQVNLRVIDPQTGASQAERWLTERLGIPAGGIEGPAAWRDAAVLKGSDWTWDVVRALAGVDG